jgi:uncharacterized pyridoxal phosphate-containing UPF0001 family protein
MNTSNKTRSAIKFGSTGVRLGCLYINSYLYLRNCR